MFNTEFYDVYRCLNTALISSLGMDHLFTMLIDIFEDNNRQGRGNYHSHSRRSWYLKSGSTEIELHLFILSVSLHSLVCP